MQHPLTAASRQATNMHTSSFTRSKIRSQTHAQTHALTQSKYLVTTLRLLLAATTFSTAIGTAVTAHAQSSGNATVAMTATVVQPLQVTALRSLDFGTVFVGATKTITSTSPTAGQIDIKGQSGALLSVTITMPTSLMLGSTGTGLVTNNWTYSTSISPSPTTFPGGTATPVTLALPNTGGSPHFTLNIGATVSASVNQPSGDYTGSGQVTVAYTDL
jgi:hypothetical protein